MQKVGLFLKRQEMTKLFRHFDINGNERLVYAEFMRALQGDISERRCGIIRQVFDLFAKGREYVCVDDLKANFDASNHPSVMTGELSSESIFIDFLNCFDGAGEETGGRLTWYAVLPLLPLSSFLSSLLSLSSVLFLFSLSSCFSLLFCSLFLACPSFLQCH